MINDKEITAENIDTLFKRLKKEAEASGYHLNPDIEFTNDLVAGLIINENRYGYQACPCRLASGIEKEDLDIICPCDYRDPDVTEFDTCYCGLYVSQAVVDKKKKIGKIPERRPPEKERKKTRTTTRTRHISRLSLPVWRCRVCGYLCARDAPPEVCPICKAKKERFEQFF